MTVHPPAPRPRAAVFELTAYIGPRIAEDGQEEAAAALIKALLDQPGWDRDALIAAVAALTVRVHRAGQAFYRIEQALGRALGYPAYGPEMSPDGIPTGDVFVEDPETVAEEAAARIRRDATTLAQVDVLLQALADLPPAGRGPTPTEIAQTVTLSAVRGVIAAREGGYLKCVVSRVW